jgi:hypothetical protein
MDNIIHKQLTQHQLEIWLNDPVTKYYLQALWWSRDQVKEVQGKGGWFDINSMEKTFAGTAISEGKKEGYDSAMQVVNELSKHSLLDDDVNLEMPKLEKIIDTIYEA